jgi:chemotaxis protein methyltransferase WspC
MMLGRIKGLLKDRIGLHSATVGDSTIRNAVNRRMAICGCTTEQEFLDILLTSGAELTELIEAVVIPETWFFRNDKSFVALREQVRQWHQSGRLRAPLRALSLPCSTGEEPYSIAITLLEAGLDTSRFRVDAVDISRHALESAKQGRYGAHSFRGRQDARIKRRYFAELEGAFSVAQEVRTAVNFRHGNILKPATLSEDASYDVIFCRNLLIYFDEDTKLRAYQNIHRLLKDDGLLVLGHAECGTAPATLFASLGQANSFAFHKQHARAAARPTPVRHAAKAVAAPVRRQATARPRAAPKSPQVQTPVPEPICIDLSQAQTLADQGRFDDAFDMCRQYLNSHRPSAQAFFLLGLIEDARQHPRDAEAYLRKAIYLEPRHYESLVHLALLLERQGDVAAARLLRQRAERTQLSTGS